MKLRQVAVLVALPLLACHSRPAVTAGPGRTSHQPVRPDRVVAPGVTESWEGDVELSPDEQGQIAEVLVAEGDVVQQGQLLLRLDDTQQAIAVELARSELAEARAVLTRLERGATTDEVIAARAEREAARARSERARQDAARTETLSQGGAIPLAELERSAAEAESASAASSAAEARLRIIERGARREDLDAARAKVGASHARLRGAEAALARRRVTAPSAGTVLWSRWQVGELFVAGSTPIVVLGNTSRIQVRTEVDELDAASVTRGASCEAFSDLGERVGGCRVVRLSPMFGRRALRSETPTTRTDVRVREVFVEMTDAHPASGQRLWVHFSTARSSG